MQIRPVLIQVALAARKVKGSYCALLYQRLAGQRGHKRAIVAVAHHIVRPMYHIVLNHEPYREPETKSLDRYLEDRSPVWPRYSPSSATPSSLSQSLRLPR